MENNSAESGTRPMTADEILEHTMRQLNAARRRYSSDKDGVSICRSLPRKASGRITASERRKLEDFGDQFYEAICDHYWMGMYPDDDAPYIEEALETLPDGSVRYSATFLPERFTPDLPEQSE